MVHSLTRVVQRKTGSMVQRLQRRKGEEEEIDVSVEEVNGSSGRIEKSGGRKKIKKVIVCPHLSQPL